MSVFLVRTRQLSPLSQHSWHDASLVLTGRSRAKVPSQFHGVSRQKTSLQTSTSFRSSSSWSSASKGSSDAASSRPSWSDEWKRLGLGASLVGDDIPLTNLLFVEVGFGADQHGSDDATKAAVRAVRNAIEFNSIPGVIEAIPGGRQEMLIQVKLGIPPGLDHAPMPCDVMEVAKVFPYGKVLPIQKVVGGLWFPTGRIVEELGDINYMGVCVAACVSIGYNNGSKEKATYTTYNTKGGY